jgi:RNA polymerase sigma-70 factor (sigma-E family)
MVQVLPAFEDFVEASADRLLRTAFLITSDDREAEDLVQECLLQVARRWRRVSVMDQPVAYARQVLVRLAVRGSRQRERRRTELGNEMMETAAVSTPVELLGTREELRAALRQLTPRQRAVLVLRYFHDLSEAQIADALDCPIGTVKSTTSRSLVQLRELIEPAPLTTGSEK